MQKTIAELNTSKIVFSQKMLSNKRVPVIKNNLKNDLFLL